MLLSAWYYAWHTFEASSRRFYCLHVVLLLSLPLMSAFHHKVNIIILNLPKRQARLIVFKVLTKIILLLSSVQTFLTFTILYLNVPSPSIPAHTLPCGSEEGLLCEETYGPVFEKMLSCSQKGPGSTGQWALLSGLQAAAVSKTLCISSEALGQSICLSVQLQSV